MQIPVPVSKTGEMIFGPAQMVSLMTIIPTHIFMIDNFRSVEGPKIFGNFELNYKATNWMTLTYRLGATISNGSAKRHCQSLTTAHLPRQVVSQ